ncbi:hypothetical protein GXP67_34610 [Rhodocytophaga rosea]|uniref:Uncharacterized protein n=1 Tax=Rhodocytophaga rosea TaxID=2704465 RepID=A0A6C0GTD7_9BACT|nr:hypothetical protein [Rhodocytophaga rosea]QHT71429.1 hypothetical protein GXP67_34610 [Rhodocytophaga rosea]
MQLNNRFTKILVLLFLAVAVQTFAQKQEYPFPLQAQEQVISNTLISSKHLAFLVKFDLKQKYTRLKAVAYSSQNRQKLQEITIDSSLINPWQNYPGKGTVRQTFENAVLSGRRSDTQAPLEYQYQVNYSPDNKTILCYRYDYSQPDLYVHCILLNAELQVLQTFNLPIDESKTNHGIFVTHSGNVCLLNTDAADGIELLQYEPASGNASLIEISASSTRRNSFKLVFLPDHRLYLAAVSESNGSFTGLLCYRLNLKTNRVEESYFFPLSKETLTTIQGLPGKGRYDLLAFSPQENRFSFELQKRNIAATDYVYDAYAVNDLQQWNPRKMQVQTGEKLLLTYNAESKVVSEKVVEGMETY